ncbi:MAG: hypothetical protein Ta2F_02210 [Termitinemataceae bacterium]|nr:MAG: hypothetical protein Ta2F_02210 [Termitinemataceae bacterium]
MNEKRPVRFFNTTGPCNPWDHYMLPPAERLIGAQLDRYIRDKLYWVLHAPRQTGKTTFLQSWAREINAEGSMTACYVSVEECQGLAERTEANSIIYQAICRFAGWANIPVPKIEGNTSDIQLSATLGKWAALVAPKPLIVLFDEVDVLAGDPLVSFLRQLRGGFAERETGKFPISIVLVGMRDLKDYITLAKDGKPVNPGSPFNIKEDSAVIGNFRKQDVQNLFAQRTEETGQQITPDALDYVWEQSKGQPWIVNSLFKRATMRILKEDDYSTVTMAHIKKAREQMIRARETHLDALAVRMDDEHICKIIESLMSGDADPLLAKSDAFRYCLDLGLVSMEHGTPQIANPIYRETLARVATFGAQAAIVEPEWRWQNDDGTLDMDALLKEFQKFWRANSEIWEQKMNYTEAFPHLLLQAFLQRVLNGGGSIDREYAAGRGRMDLAVEYNGKKYIIEIKLIYDYSSPQTVREDGLKQIAKYRDTVDPSASSYLVIFDRRSEGKKLPWDERIKWDEENGITVVGC